MQEAVEESLESEPNQLEETELQGAARRARTSGCAR